MSDTYEVPPACACCRHGLPNPLTHDFAAEGSAGSSTAPSAAAVPMAGADAAATGTLLVPPGGGAAASTVISGTDWTAARAAQGGLTTLTYSFPASLPPAHAGQVDGFSAFTAAQQADARAAFDAFSAVSGLRFQEVAADGDLQMMSGALPSGTLGYAYFPGAHPLAGDVVLSTALADLSPGGQGFLTLLHEIGHAVGLKHSGPYGAADPGPYLPGPADTTATTVMSYTDPPGPVAAGLGPVDVMALQILYGWADGRSAVDGAGAAVRDGTAGRDYFDAGGGADVARLGGGSDTVAGGDGADTLSGGAGADLIYGNRHLDRIEGGDGADVIFGGQNAGAPRPDAYGNVRMQDGVEHLFGNQGGDLIYGNFGTDVVHGGQGNDTVYGGQNEDVLHGDRGDDVIWGNRDDDVLWGGAGADRFVFAANGGTDRIEDFEDGLDRIGLRGLSAAQAQVSAAGADAVVTFAGAATAVVVVGAAGRIGAEDFDLV